MMMPNSDHHHDMQSVDLDDFLLLDKMMMKQQQQQHQEQLTKQQEYQQQQQQQEHLIQKQQQQQQQQYFCEDDHNINYHHDPYDDDDNSKMQPKKKNMNKKIMKHQTINKYILRCLTMKQRYKNLSILFILILLLLLLLFIVTRIVYYYPYNRDENKNITTNTSSQIATSSSLSEKSTTLMTSLQPLPEQQQKQQQQSQDKKLRNIKSTIMALKDNKKQEQYNDHNNTPRVLLGIITFDIFGEQQYRNNYRQLFQLLYPRICHIHDYYNSNQNDNPCELIYTFVLYDTTDNNNHYHRHNDDVNNTNHTNNDENNNSIAGMMNSSESEPFVRKDRNYFNWTSLSSMRSFLWRLIRTIFNYHNKLLPLLFFRSSSLIIDSTNKKNHHDDDTSLLQRLIQQQNNNKNITRYSNYSTDLNEYDMMFIIKKNSLPIDHYNDYQNMKHQLSIDWLQFICCTTTFQDNNKEEDSAKPPFFDYVTYISTQTMISLDMYFQFISSKALPPFPYNHNVIASSNNNNNTNENDNMDIISYNLIPYFLDYYVSNFDQQHDDNLKSPHDYLSLFRQKQQGQYQTKNNNDDIVYKKSSLHDDDDDDNNIIETYYDHIIKHIPIPYPLFWKHCSIRMDGPKKWNQKWIYELYHIMKRRHHIVGGQALNSSSSELLSSLLERRRTSSNIINGVVSNHNSVSDNNKESLSVKTAMLRNVDPTFHLFLYKKYYETTTNDTTNDSSSKNNHKYGNNELDDDFIIENDDEDNVPHYVSPPDVIIVDNKKSNHNKGKKRIITNHHINNNNRHHCHNDYDSANSINEYLYSTSRNNYTDMFIVKWNQSGILQGTSFIRHDDWFRDNEIDHIRQIHPRNQNIYMNHMKNNDNNNHYIIANSNESDIIAIVFNTDVLHHIDWTYIPPVPVLVYTIPNDVVNNGYLNTSFTLIPPPYDRGYNQWCIWKAEHDNAILPFDQRRNIIIWRGALHSTIDPNRITLVQMSSKSDDNRIWLNASLTDDHELSIEEMVQFKYHIDIGGESGTSWGGIRWKMCTGSLVFKVDTWSQDWWHSMILPYVHYIPVKYDLSNLYEQYIYAELNPDIIYRIVQNGSKFCNDNVKLSTVVNYWRNVIETLPITMNPIIVNEANELIMKYTNNKQQQLEQKVV